MEFKTLWLGLVISMAAFAVKTGLGWGYLWLKYSPGKRIPASLAVLAVYGLLFSGVLGLVKKLDLLAHYELLIPLWQGGVTLHWLVAGLLFLWGLALLKAPRNRDAGEAGSRGWLALVIPCPVCFSVILMSVAGLALYFPEKALAGTAGLFLAFTTIALVGGLLMIKGRSNDGEVESTLGLVMILMAMYFILSALVAPQFAEVDKIYRLAAYGAESRKIGTNISGWFLIASSALLAGFGYFINLKSSKKRLENW